MKSTIGTRFPRTLVAAGYLLISLLAGNIMYLWYYEWEKIETLETESRLINGFRQNMYHVYGQIARLSLLGKSVLGWEHGDLEHYHVQRMVMDSILCRFKVIYPAERINSVRHLLEDRELQMRRIVQVLDEQQALNEKNE